MSPVELLRTDGGVDHSSNDQRLRLIDLEGQIAAIHKSQAVVEFDLQGNVLSANENFLRAMNYDEKEVLGKNHKMFCDPSWTQTIEYRAFWDKLSRGQFDRGEYRRLGKNGKQVWINATYNPINDAQGHPFKVVKYAFDVTDTKMRNANWEGQIAAIHKSQAVIEFDLSGNVITANDNFLKTLGWQLNEISGRHHRTFCDPDYVKTKEYKEFWEKLLRGEFVSGEFRRLNKQGNEIWIQASYNPILDLNGKPFKIVKFAFDISQQKLKDAQLAALSRAQAVIEFAPNGTILDANDNFLTTIGYQIEEIKGRHHSMFCDKELLESASYKDFWQKLAQGQFQAGEFQRIGKNQKVVWIQASYNPVFDLTGKVFKVVKYASDITKSKLESLEVLQILAQTSSQLAQESSKLSSTATQMTSVAESANSKARSTASASEEMSRGVRVVAANTEELSASVKEIARNAADASAVSDQSLRQTLKANETIALLGRSSQEIGNVIKVISSIAQQTNLLALNATIEAARAGEYGRGFAVVANEVKELARQTARATEEITQKIVGIQSDSQGAVSAVESIKTSIERLNSIATAIAAAVEEQSATSNEVARVLQESAQAVGSISDNIKDVSSSAEETHLGASAVLGTSKGLSELAQKLEHLVKRVRG
jgi:methyl-accepting chemotaxis protein